VINLSQCLMLLLVVSSVIVITFSCRCIFKSSHRSVVNAVYLGKPKKPAELVASVTQIIHDVLNGTLNIAHELPRYHQEGHTA